MRKRIDEWTATIFALLKLFLTIVGIIGFLVVGITLYNSSLTQSDFEEFKVEFEDDVDENFDELQDEADENFDELREYMDGRFDRLESLIDDSPAQQNP